MIYHALEVILSDDLTRFIGDPEVTVEVAGLATRSSFEIRICRDGKITAEMDYVTGYDGIIGTSGFVRSICVDTDGNRIKPETEEEDFKYQESIIKYLSKLAILD